MKKELLYDMLQDNDDLEARKEVFIKLLDLLDRSIKMVKEEDKVDVNKQTRMIRALLANCSEEDAVDISNAWYELQSAVRNVPWYDNMHVENGGIVDSGDDGFYMDFASWLASRGTEFLVDYFTREYKYVLKYIKDNDIDRREYLYEGISYEFLDYAF